MKSSSLSVELAVQLRVRQHISQFTLARTHTHTANESVFHYSNSVNFIFIKTHFAVMHLHNSNCTSSQHQAHRQCVHRVWVHPRVWIQCCDVSISLHHLIRMELFTVYTASSAVPWLVAQVQSHYGIVGWRICYWLELMAELPLEK